MNCPSCGTPVRTEAERCHACGADVGFPNVRYAEEQVQRDALAKRVADARVSVKARNCLPNLNAFDAAMHESQAVLARSLGDLDSFIRSENELYVSFHSQVRAGSRLTEQNEWDPGRSAAESTVNPQFNEKINYTALSLDGFGVLWWGDYSIVLKEAHIAKRTSVFEENPFVFCQRHHIVAGKPAPPGYRSSWNARNDLAVAKLHSKIEATTKSDKFSSIVINQGLPIRFVANGAK